MEVTMRHLLLILLAGACAGDDTKATDPSDTDTTGDEPTDTEPADTEPADTDTTDTEPADTDPTDTEPAEPTWHTVPVVNPSFEARTLMPDDWMPMCVEGWEFDSGCEVGTLRPSSTNFTIYDPLQSPAEGPHALYMNCMSASQGAAWQDMPYLAEEGATWRATVAVGERRDIDSGLQNIFLGTVDGDGAWRPLTFTQSSATPSDGFTEITVSAVIPADAAGRTVRVQLNGVYTNGGLNQALFDNVRVELLGDPPGSEVALPAAVPCDGLTGLQRQGPGGIVVGG
jgi:hypothetical protein